MVRQEKSHNGSLHFERYLVHTGQKLSSEHEVMAEKHITFSIKETYICILTAPTAVSLSLLWRSFLWTKTSLQVHQGPQVAWQSNKYAEIRFFI